MLQQFNTLANYQGKMAERIYFISGLGADKRIFRRLTFPTHFELVHIDWIAPYKNELLKDYAIRLSGVIDQSQPFYLIGVSFGGFIATEIATVLQPKCTILISSIPISNDMPWYYKLAGRLRLLNILPASQFKSANTLAYKLFGTKKAEHKIMLKQILQDTDSSFLKWALSSALNWRNNVTPKNLLHIHGSSDRILPLKYTHPDVVIEAGGHLMVYANAKELSSIILPYLRTF